MIGIADGRGVARHAVDRLGDEVLMIGRLYRHADAGQPAKLLRPDTGTVDHFLAADRAVIRGHHPADRAGIRTEAGNRNALTEPRPLPWLPWQGPWSGQTALPRRRCPRTLRRPGPPCQMAGTMRFASCGEMISKPRPKEWAMVAAISYSARRSGVQANRSEPFWFHPVA